ncbi:uncharacterized protein LOC131069319 isoform X2 [Cryptomeria japonica]|uniref:uncharacterized protein LOC131069319 isoform X2 n=1 Tax=Cryptomeria japonica TaxID=3369 RepID=UPI0027DA9CC6|nr:uncharacterized protein LOC131069319 isoform X2 [Cryptomeria japonica]
MAGKLRRKPRGRGRRGRNVQASRKPRGKRNQGYMEAKKRRKREFSEGSDSSDEDFVLDEEEEEDDDIESTSGEELNESDEEEEAESTESEESEEECNLPKPRRNLMPRQKSYSNGKAQALKKKPRNQSIKRIKRSSSDDDEDFDPDFSSTTEHDDSVDDDNEGEGIAKSQKRKRTAMKSSSSSTRKLKKRKKSTASSKKLVQIEKKSMPATKRRRTTAVSQKVIRSTASAGSESDEDFVVVPRRRTKHQGKSSQSAEMGWLCPRRGKLNNCSRKLDSSSDSDFICSESDADYRISAEEGELSCQSHSFTKSANCSMRASSAEKQEIVSCFRDRQEKKRKSISDSDISRSEEGLRKKGKEKVGESMNFTDSDLPKPVCGICLSDEGKAIRGKLDCCDHYFCFACIMEWAKVESRCPMCKQRLSMISKSSISGKGLRGTAIKIPVRDQVYQPSEEEVMGFLDPYADIVCLECHEAGDDSLLLLCDLCDSAYHTYCVGLGRAVPEGDWYCQACQTSRPAQNNTEEEEVDDFVLDLHNEDDGLTIRELVEDTPINRCTERINLDLSLSPPSSSVFVRDTTPSCFRTVRRRIFRRSGPNPSPRLSDPARAPVRQTQLFGSTSQVSGAGARTLSGQRRLQERVHVLHDNWSAQERASQQLSPGFLAGSNYGIDDGVDATVLPIINKQSCLSRESARTSNLDSSVVLENGLCKSEIYQAWSMMDKSIALGGGDVQTIRGGRYLQGSSSAHCKDDFSDLMGDARTRLKHGTSSPSAAQSKTSNSQGRLHPESINCRDHSQRISEEGSCRGISNNVQSAPDVSNRRPCSNLIERIDNSSICLNNPVLGNSKPHENELRKVEGAKDHVRTLVKTHMKKMIAGKETN